MGRIQSFTQATLTSLLALADELILAVIRPGGEVVVVPPER